ncbi:MAG: SURF1 family protein [Burkholderiaceae bacterium]
MGLKFWLALAFGIVGVVLALAAAVWQVQRANDKLALQARWEAALAAPAMVIDRDRPAPAKLEVPRQVELRGEFIPAATLYLDNRMLGGVAGFRVITPVQRAPGAPWVLVDRGFAPRDATDRSRLPPAPLPAGEVAILGVAVDRAPRALELGGAPERRLPGIWQNLDYDAFEAASGAKVERFLVLQSSPANDGLRRNASPPAAGVDKHRGYAFQWAAIAALIAGLTVFFGFRTWKHASKH